MIWLITAGVVLLAMNVFLMLSLIGAMTRFTDTLEAYIASQEEDNPTERIFGKVE